MTSDNAWRSLHVFVWDGAKADCFLAAVMLPRLLRAGQDVRWFFIRYWEGGPHIRLRLQADDSVVRTLIAEFSHAVKDYLSPSLLDPARYYGGNVFERPVDNIGAEPWFAEGAVEEIAYAPETTRYGGPAALPYQEELFELSSRLAAKIIIATQDAWPRRAALSIQMMIAAGLSVTASADDAAQFFVRYAEYWKPFARKEIQPPPLLDYTSISRAVRATGKQNLPQIWLGALEQTNAVLLDLCGENRLIAPQTGRPAESETHARDALRTIVASQMHMLNNRLGIGPEREHAFALAIAAGAAAAPRILTNVMDER